MYYQLASIRANRHWSRSYVANAIGVSAEMIRLLELGQRKPSYEVLCKLEDLFQLSHRELFAPADFEAKGDDEP